MVVDGFLESDILILWDFKLTEVLIWVVSKKSQWMDTKQIEDLAATYM